MMERLNIAVVGAGVSGLVCADLLQHEHEVTLIERNDYVGGHTNTITIPEGPDAGTCVDTGFIVYNSRNYPNFINWLERHGIQGQDSDMSFGYSSELSNVAYSSFIPWGIFAQKKNIFSPRFHKMIRDIKTFNEQATSDLNSGGLGNMTLAEYVADKNYSAAFRDFYLFPMGAAIWSTSLDEMAAFPAEAFFRFFSNHGLLALKDRPQWMVIPGGSQNYVKQVLANFKGTVKTNAEISSISRTQDEVSVRYQTGETERFDYVVLATHADEALVLLEEPSDEERRLLSPWEYSSNHTVLHWDESVMPKEKGAWASWNYRVEKPHSASHPVTLTYHMNRLQSLKTTRQYFVTLNREKAIDPLKITKEIDYMHPKYSIESMATQAELPKLNGQNRSFFCGSYFSYGFHEDAVKAALAVVKHFGVSI